MLVTLLIVFLSAVVIMNLPHKEGPTQPDTETLRPKTEEAQKTPGANRFRMTEEEMAEHAVKMDKRNEIVAKPEEYRWSSAWAIEEGFHNEFGELETGRLIREFGVKGMDFE